MIYLYAIVDGLARVDDHRGIAGEPLRILTVESFSVVSGDLPRIPPVDRPVLADQDRVVRELHASADALLPLRFGTAYTSIPAAGRALATRAPALRDALSLVHRREQMTLRVLGAMGPLSRPEAARATGTQYLERRAAAAVPREIVPLLEELKLLQRATRIEAAKTAGVIASVYQLIDRGASEKYVKRVEDAACGLKTLTVRVSGPAPCYAFAS